jgi:hypothetical protein
MYVDIFLSPAKNLAFERFLPTQSVAAVQTRFPRQDINCSREVGADSTDGVFRVQCPVRRHTDRQTRNCARILGYGILGVKSMPELKLSARKWEAFAPAYLPVHAEISSDSPPLLDEMSLQEAALPSRHGS